jgi:serine protease Do
MSKRSLIPGILTLFVFFLFSFSLMAEEAKSASQGWLGIYIQDISTGLMEAMDLKSLKGVLVNKVVDDSPADEGGMERGDVIIEFDEKRVVDSDQFVKLVRKTKPRDKVNILIIRDDDEKIITVKMGKVPKSDISTLKLKKPEFKKGEFKIFGFGESTYGKIGVTLWDLNEQLGEYFGVMDGEGALVAELDDDGPAYDAGLRAGDVIVEMDGDNIEDKGDVFDVLSEKDEGDEVKIEVLRKGSRKTFMVEVEEEDDLHSYFYKGDDDIKIYTSPFDQLGPLLKEHKLEKFEEEKLRDELEELKEELMELKEELQKLKDKI